MASAAAPVKIRPIHMPAHSSAKRRNRSSPIAAATSAGPVCQRQPRTSPHADHHGQPERGVEHVRAGPAQQHGCRRHRHRPEAIGDALVRVLGHRDHRLAGPEGHRHDEHAGHQELDVGTAAGHGHRPAEEEREQDDQHDAEAQPGDDLGRLSTPELQAAQGEGPGVGQEPAQAAAGDRREWSASSRWSCRHLLVGRPAAPGRRWRCRGRSGAGMPRRASAGGR